ncbi:hypothetical protein [Limnoraphis robusta]|uniref:DUF2281 domain-containing protein n=1 Tax=Limnoraphis robusta CS-951 TaxID=1637645 RepID=A0A0F5Y8J6_9CYAN|nr:hypothetical protein [Limnoraphis robusta]KKD35068.1 hypothetical protein WN50_27370 [Limnoraphis robusta CS-951]
MISTSTIIQAINQVLVNLSPEKQQEVLDFAEFILSRSNLSKEPKSKAVLVQELRELFKELQSMPEIQEITEAEIRAEIDAYRQGIKNRI